MSAAPSLSDENGKSKTTGDKLPSRWSFRKVGKIIAATVAGIAAIAGLMANLSSIGAFFQPSLSGQWRLTLTIRQSSYKEYIGQSATFQVFLVYDGNNLNGSGEKIQVDGKDIPVGQHQPITMTGEISGSQVIFSYREKPGPDGKARETSGQFVLDIIRHGILNRTASRMQGTFSGTAAATTGTAVATKLN
ncbi:MAG TPA: hypothetical protein VIY49_11045 [Bryobacteraceae bacterium]